jgi:molybdopterin-guanine dinucleotide biosynthesis protein B
MIVSIVGSPDSGKTTLIETVVPLLKQRGLRVAVVKHHAHGDFSFDREGKDSWRFYNRGADVLVVCPGKLAMVRRTGENEYSLDYVYERFLKDKYDIVLTEGFNSAGKDRIVVLNPSDNIERFRKGKIMAVVCERDLPDYKTFRLKEEDFREIAEMIAEKLKSQ